MPFRHALNAVLALSLVALALLAGGCGGGGSKAPGVASVGPSHAGTTTTQGGSSPGGSLQSGSSSGSGGGGPQMTMKMANGAKYAACMRSHGVPRFPDPSSQGTIEIGPHSGIDPSSPKFQAADKACQKVLPNGGQPTPAEQAKMQQQMLKFSACMRSHGVPSFPDPTFSEGHAQLSIGGRKGSGLDPKSPKFQAAQKACQGDMFGKLSGGPVGAK